MSGKKGRTECRIAEGEEDPLCHDPIDEIAQQLDGVTDPEVFRKYTLWLAARAPDAALNVSFPLACH